MTKPRPHQREAVDAVRAAFEVPAGGTVPERGLRAQVVMATGSGKTLVAALPSCITSAVHSHAGGREGGGPRAEHGDDRAGHLAAVVALLPSLELLVQQLTAASREGIRLTSPVPCPKCSR
ncbi:DEAD/DEAH box helicase family protein [Streptomyces sp. NPDC127168]|uniref:DEAD/DEAH box helicase family protein n=1 Tax=unclassified Streptomyces TaxID=2593676 RepID=UPI00362BF6C9